MRSNIVLIDFENVQPDTLEALEPDHFRVLIFVGASQSKVPFEMAAALQRLGTRAEYIKISGNGPNALDFHIAYYVGQLAATDPSAFFHIVSKDKGFDPLIAHLKSKKIFAGRVTSLASIPVLKVAGKRTQAQRVDLVLERLRQPKATRPRTVKTLSNAVLSMFQKQLSEAEVSATVQGMINAKSISIDGDKVTYAINRLADAES